MSYVFKPLNVRETECALQRCKWHSSFLVTCSRQRLHPELVLGQALLEVDTAVTVLILPYNVVSYNVKTQKALASTESAAIAQREFRLK